MSVSWRHPSEKSLDRWSGGARGSRASRHARSCGLCQSRLEALTELEPHVTAQLEADLVPSADFAERLSRRLDEKVTNREALAVLSDLFDVGPKTTRLFVENDRGDDRKHE